MNHLSQNVICGLSGFRAVMLASLVVFLAPYCRADSVTVHDRTGTLPVAADTEGVARVLIKPDKPRSFEIVADKVSNLNFNKEDAKRLDARKPYETYEITSIIVSLVDKSKPGSFNIEFPSSGRKQPKATVTVKVRPHTIVASTRSNENDDGKSKDTARTQPLQVPPGPNNNEPKGWLDSVADHPFIFFVTLLGFGLIASWAVLVGLRRKPVGGETHTSVVAARLQGLSASAPAAPLPAVEELGTPKEAYDLTANRIEAIRREFTGEIEKIRAEAKQDATSVEARLLEIEKATHLLYESLSTVRQQNSELVEQIRLDRESAERTRQAAESGLQQHLRELLALRVPSFGGNGGVTDDQQALISAQFQEALENFFRAAVPSGDGLRLCTQRCEHLIAELNSFREAVTVKAPEVIEKTAPVLADARQLREEICGLLVQGDERRLRLTFAMEFFTPRSSRERLLDGLAAGLKNEMLKLADAPRYFDWRLGQVATTAAAVAADFADRMIDPQRGDPTVQSLLRNLFQAGGVTEIAPCQNEDFRGVEHSVVEMRPRTSAADRSQAVAQLVVRGFRYRDQVIRKASVLLFQ